MVAALFYIIVFIIMDFTMNSPLPETKGNPTCKKDEQYYDHKPDCKNTCAAFNNPGIRCRAGEPGCFCRDGFVKRKDGKCVLFKDCDNETCGRNEIYTDCVDSCNDCASIGVTCSSLVCNKGCDCKPGYRRDIRKNCILESQCPTKNDNNKTKHKNLHPKVTSKYVSKEDAHICEPGDKCYVIEKWNHTVPYKISDTLSTKLKNVLQDTIREWNSTFENCIELSEWKSEKEYVSFIGGDECKSSLGKRPGGQTIMLNEGCSTRFGKIAHEIMHTVGFLHEHTRPDRDDYIEVDYDTIPDDWRIEYQKVSHVPFGILGPYDFYSVMHYRPLGAERETPSPAFKILQKGINELMVGAQKTLTDLDKLKVRKLYCPDKKHTF